VRRLGVEDGFDLSVTQEFGVDHAMLVPLHYLTDGVKIPVVPVWVNAFVKPLPTARRCYALGAMVRRAIETWPQKLRVAAVGSGSFSLEIGGPKVKPGERTSVPDPAWSRHVRDRIERAEIDELVKESTPEQMSKAGNIGGELLNWITLLGVVGKHKPHSIMGEGQGDAYAAWRWN
jgi:protocatechuate 4,5-dioxygenase beta chain